MSRINTHEVLKDWHGHTQYPHIAKYAVGLANEGLKERDILELVERRFEAKLLGRKMKASPLNIWGEDLIDAKAISQMYDALRIPPAINGALMPDSHPGYALPIGGVIALEQSISPNFIGYDISCMMRITMLDISHDSLMKHRESFLNILSEVTSFGLGSTTENANHKVMDSELWNSIGTVKPFKGLAQQQLGSSGGGNHFANIMLGKYLETDEKFVALMTHSGSRGTGHKLATHYVKLAKEFVRNKYKNVKNDYEWLELDTDLGKEYQRVMWLLGEYAFANHEIIHDRFVNSAVLESKKYFWNRHNFAWVEGKKIIHRKGATPAQKANIGIIPGTSGSKSYLVRGKGNPDSLFSASHGAGRVHSRTKAKEVFDKAAFNNTMERLDIRYRGINEDEGLYAYKNIELVMNRQQDLITPIAEMIPAIVIMGGKSDDGD